MTDPGRALPAARSLSLRPTVERLIAAGALIAVVLWVALGRMNVEQYPYVERRTREGRSKREIIRSLKRYVARELYRYLPRPQSA